MSHEPGGGVVVDREPKAVVQRFLDEVANGRDLAKIDELLTDDFSLPPDTPGALDRAGLKAVLQYYFNAFPDLHYELKDLLADGDRVVTRLSMTGTHQGDYAGVAGSGKAFEVEEVDIFNVTGGRIEGYRIVWDELSFRRQLGLPLDA